MRFKFDREDPNAYRCCLCFHVRTGTVLLGIWHLLMHILVLSLVGVVLMNPGLLPNTQEQNSSSSANLMYPDVQGDDPYNYDSWLSKNTWTSEDKFMGMLITLTSFLITCMLVYGALRGKAGYLMPFFCLQVFDFCITCLTIVGYFSYTPNMKVWVAQQDGLPFKEYLLKMNPDWLMLLVVTFFVFVMTIKAYFIGVVWACYKYLTNRQLQGEVIRRVDNMEDGEMLLPPKYEDVVNIPAEQPPPAYMPN